MITLTDIFAGAGGSSTGAIAVPGVEVSLAANHWKLAVEVHGENHPCTNHACVDLHMEDPRNFPRTDILWASPECTKWSIANSKAKALSVEMGGDPTLFDDVPVELESGPEDEISRSRLLMFDVLRFVEHHRYRLVFVENVIDIATQPKYRAAWAAWQKGLRRLGYEYRVVSMNAMHAQMAGLPAPQSRDRLYIVAWPVGAKAPDLDRAMSPTAWCPRCETMVATHQAWKPGRTVGRYKAQYRYACSTCRALVEPGWLPASTAIDWDIPAERIADRKRPLSDKTMARIREGLRRYGATPEVLEAAGNTYDMASGSGNTYLRAWPVREPLRTLHGTASKALLVPSGGTWHETAYLTGDPMRTVTTRENHGLLIPVEGRDGKRANIATEPLRTQTCRNETGLLVPYYSASESGRPTTQPIGTLTTVDRYALVTLRGTNAPKLVDQPMDTVTASGNHHGLVNISEDDVMACRFRMLEPGEIAAGMSFPGDYRWLGTKRERVRLAGNAVCPPAARDLIQVGVDSLAA